MMKSAIITMLEAAIAALDLGLENLPTIQLEQPRDPSHGDYATNIAFLLAKHVKRAPKALAADIVAHCSTSAMIQEITCAGNGFINFVIHSSAYKQLIQDIMTRGENYGRSTVGAHRRIHLEFVSSNPTGPLHVGHGRGAAYGSTLANLLRFTGFDVTREYYVNDAGRQMDILAVSVWMRYLEQLKECFIFPQKGYQGAYVYDIANILIEKHGKEFFVLANTLRDYMIAHEESQTSDEEAYIDLLIQAARNFLGEQRYRVIFQNALDYVLVGIRQDLADFGVEFEQWFSETRLHQEGKITLAIDEMRRHGHVYDKDGALWFNSTKFGDDKDRVLLRENGTPTYFAADVAHHLHTFTQGYDGAINVFGADHHGYSPRIYAALQACGLDSSIYKILFVQFAILWRGKERVQMSTRSGEFVTLAELVKEIGKDSARFFYVSKKIEQHMDFDLEVAKLQSAENPVFYIQYAHARIASVFRQLKEKGFVYQGALDLEHFNLLTLDAEIKLLKHLNHFSDTVEHASLRYEPHLLTHYLYETARLLHNYYNNAQFLVADSSLRDARLILIAATQQILANGLRLLGITAPDTM